MTKERRGMKIEYEDKSKKKQALLECNIKQLLKLI